MVRFLAFAPLIVRWLVMRYEDWFLTSTERGNPMTEIDSHRSGVASWTEGNHVDFHIDGVSYFHSLSEEVSILGPHDEVRFVDWRGDADERVSKDGTSIAALLTSACRRGVDVRGLLWRSHSDRFGFNSKQNRRLADEVTEADGEVLLDERVRRGGSHHQKMVLVRHPSSLDKDVAFIGGIDLSHGRRDDTGHGGDFQVIKLDPRYGPRPLGTTSNLRSVDQPFPNSISRSGNDGKIRPRLITRGDFGRCSRERSREIVSPALSPHVWATPRRRADRSFRCFEPIHLGIPNIRSRPRASEASHERLLRRLREPAR